MSLALINYSIINTFFFILFNLIYKANRISRREKKISRKHNGVDFLNCTLVVATNNFGHILLNHPFLKYILRN